MKTILPLALVALSVGVLHPIRAEVVTYQGRVRSGGSDFTGTGQFKFALVTGSDPSVTTHWSNDGTSADGSEPAAAVPVPVGEGLFTARLGDTTLANMTQALDAGLFQTPDLKLRIWFNDGVNGFAAFVPDQELTAAPRSAHAVFASTVEGGTISNPVFLGTTTSAALEFSVNNLRAMRFEDNGDGPDLGGGTDEAPNVIGGSPLNLVAAGQVGATIGGGGGIDDTNSFSPLPRPNTTQSGYTMIGGGWGNSVGTIAHFATIGGGEGNAIGTLSSGATIGGGKNNVCNGDSSTIGGGVGNQASVQAATVAGGNLNTSSGPNATVGGGSTNSATESEATVGGGQANLASGVGATVPGGSQNRAAGIYAFAAGRRAKADHGGAFVWADNTPADFVSSSDNQFLIRAAGGVGIGTNSPSEQLHVVGNILATGTIVPNSDRRLNTDIEEVDPAEVLDRVATLPIRRWRFKAEVVGTKHIGPMAQDFRAAFGLGTHPTAIATVDADGVALAAIQGLNAKLEARLAEKDERIAELEKRLAELAEAVGRLETSAR